MKIFKYLILINLFLILLIKLKSDPNFKNNFYKEVYQNNFTFAKLNKIYKSRFGTILPFEKYLKPVFNEKLTYKESNKYLDGVSLKVNSNLIPSLDNGIVIFVGQKEDYGNTIIIQQENGLDVWYSNLNQINLKMYDYVKKGNLIGEVDEKLYLVFMKNGIVEDYKKYI